MGIVTAARLRRALGLPRGTCRSAQMRRVLHAPAVTKPARPICKHWSDGYAADDLITIESRIRSFRKETRLFFLTGKLASERGKWELEAKRFRERYQSEPIFNLLVRLRRRLRKFVSGGRSETMLELVGCDQDSLRRHIEVQFTKGMSWANMGLWHIDHIIPCSSFNLSQLSQRQICFHFTNLQPLWASDNMRKRDSITKPQLPLLLSA